VQNGPSFTISNVRYPTNDGSSKKFYHRIPATQSIVAIWQRIWPALRIRSRVARSPNVPESAKRPPSASASTKIRHKRTTEPDSITPTGHHRVRWPIPLWLPVMQESRDAPLRPQAVMMRALSPYYDHATSLYSCAIESPVFCGRIFSESALPNSETVPPPLSMLSYASQDG
jgi:hypothetical protein